MTAIVYVSKTGFTEKYARLLAAETGLPLYRLEEAAGGLEKEADIIYLGWLKAGGIQGYRKAARLWQVRAVGAVGMAMPTEKTAGEIRERHQLGQLPFVLLQGGFDLSRLFGLDRLVMRILTNMASKRLAEKPSLNDEERQTLDLMQNGGDLVSAEKLQPLLDWWKSGGSQA